MTLYKQIILMIFIIITLILAIVMSINYTASKKYMEDELYKSTVNSLLAISNRIAQSKGEKTYIQGIIDSEFDSGYYQNIQFVSNNHNWSYQQSYRDAQDSVPKWFIKFANVKEKMLDKEVFLGWSMIGKLSLQLELSTLYETLYQTFVKFFYLFIIFTLLSSLLFTFVLKIILRPLKDIQRQADAIAHHEYIILENIPQTVELREVVLSMNTMVQKIKFMFESVNRQLCEQKVASYTDSLTQLKSREYLVDKLPEYLKLDAPIHLGVNIIISIHGMIETNKKVGRRRADQFYVEIAKIFKETTRICEETIIARMNGTEFNIFMPNYPIESVKDMILIIKRSATTIIQEYGMPSNILYLSFGVCEYSHTQTPNELLTLTDYALQKAKNNYSHIYYQTFTNQINMKGKDQWRELLNKSLQQKYFSFMVSNVVDMQTKKHYHSFLNIVIQKSQKRYNYEEFMPLAIEFGLSSKIYSQIISKILIDKEAELDAINVLQLPYDYLYTKSSYENIKKLCIEFSSTQQYSLTLEISDKFIRDNPILIDAYQRLLQAHNISIGVFEFIGEGVNYEYLRKLNPDYIKMNASFLLSRTPQEFLSLQTLMKTLNITPIATEVEEESISNRLQALGIYTMQGSYIH